MTALDDRRQSAREAFYDTYADGTYVEVRGVEEAIEVATRVRITQELIDAYSATDNIDDGLRAAFRAAGFEVVD
jgi:hypothetical protein